MTSLPHLAVMSLLGGGMWPALVQVLNYYYSIKSFSAVQVYASEWG